MSFRVLQSTDLKTRPLRLIESYGQGRSPIRRGIQRELRTLSGARAVRVIEAAGCSIDEHTHDWPVLSLYVMGAAFKIQEDDGVTVDRPAAVLHPAGTPHASVVCEHGLEQIDIEFDPAWLGASAQLFRGGPSVWRGGSVAAAATRLRKVWACSSNCEATLARETQNFFEIARAAAHLEEPDWLREVLLQIGSDTPIPTKLLARKLGLHPGWLAQRFKSLVGEGIGEASQRIRVQKAAHLLRQTDFSAARVAVEAGFCDQSHMIRSFKRVLDRPPSAVRGEGVELRSCAAH